jgi:ribose-phosphate pyrophosphokinase
MELKMKLENPVIFSTPPYHYLLKSICRLGNFETGEIERKTFPDGELYHRIIPPLADRDVVLIGGTVSDTDTLEIYDLGCAMVKYGAKTLTIVIPYYGYSTMERAVKEGEVVTAKTRARLFSFIPQSQKGNRIILLDLHSEGIPHYFEGCVRTIHLYAKDIILEGIRELAGNAPFVLASTDAGRAKWVESLANELGVKPSFVFKKRVNGKDTKILEVNAHVRDFQVIIYDDMIRTGSSLINAARAYLEAGALKVSAIVTHGIFPQDSLKKIEESGLFEKIICTDSHPKAVSLENNFLKVKSISSLMYKYLIS